MRTGLKKSGKGGRISHNCERVELRQLGQFSQTRVGLHMYRISPTLYFPAACCCFTNVGQASGTAPSFPRPIPSLTPSVLNLLFETHHPGTVLRFVFHRKHPPCRQTWCGLVSYYATVFQGKQPELHWVLVFDLLSLSSKVLTITKTLHPLRERRNVRPVRDLLHGHQPPSEANRFVLLPPWNFLRTWIFDRFNINSAVQIVCTTEIPDSKSYYSGMHNRSSHLHDTPLAGIMTFEPLKEAFGEYCRKSLCSEVCTPKSTSLRSFSLSWFVWVVCSG